MRAILFIALYVLLPPILNRMNGGTNITIAHEVFSSMGVVGIFLLSQIRNGFRIGSFFFMAAFFCVGLADFVYGFTSEIILDHNSLVPWVIVREFSYTSFSALMAMALGFLYRQELRRMKPWLAIAPLTLLFAWLGHSQIIVPLLQKPDSAILFAVTGGIYSVFRAFILAIVLKQMFFENNIFRFFFLYSLLQMFVCDFALNYQLNALDGVKTPLDTWFETGWELSTSSIFVVAFLQRNQESIFGDSWQRGIRSLRSMIVFLVISVLVIQATWLWFFDFLIFNSLMQMTHFISRAFGRILTPNC